MSPVKRWASITIFIFFFVISFVYWIDKSALTGNYFFRTFANTLSPKKSSVQLEFPFNCSNLNLTCPTNHPVTIEKEESSPVACPAYMRWIHEDLRPWKSAGITRDMVERGRDYANFRLVIVKGKAYVETYRGTFQTRDVFTIWGILQLLRLYPGKVPDLELMFCLGDETHIKKRDYQATSAPPVFNYCEDDETLDIVFPDWSFWGWAEVDIKPWGITLEALKEGNKKIKWKDRKPYAFWKGNPYVSQKRVELLKCNPSNKNDWNVRLYIQAQEIGEAGSKFIQENLKMDFVYDYMFHLLSEYSKLLKFEPTIPSGALEVCSETMACLEGNKFGRIKNFMVESMVKSPKDTLPCTMPPPL
ncbi:hypothetical protein ACB092_06G260900 [Castanea dentata]